MPYASRRKHSAPTRGRVRALARYRLRHIYGPIRAVVPALRSPQVWGAVQMPLAIRRCHALALQLAGLQGESEPSASPRSLRARSPRPATCWCFDNYVEFKYASGRFCDSAPSAVVSQADGYDEAARVSEVRHLARHAQARPPFASILASNLVVGRGGVEGYPRS